MAEDQPAGRKKRRLRAPSETVREKAVKAQHEESTQPAKRRPVRGFFRGLIWPLRWTAHRPPLKQLGHGLKWFFMLRFMRYIGIALGFRYIYNSWGELRLVTWPTRRQSRQLTVAVIIFSIIFGALIAAADYGLNKLFKEVILR